MYACSNSAGGNEAEGFQEPVIVEPPDVLEGGQLAVFGP